MKTPVHNIIYKIGIAKESEIRLHLEQCSNNFIPALENRVNLVDYSIKISRNAVTFEAWSDEELVGLIAAYFNDMEMKSGFITSVSVLKEYLKNGIASKLLRKCIEYANQLKFKEINLEVFENNEPAINLYKSFGFLITENSNNNFRMRLIL